MTEFLANLTNSLEQNNSESIKKLLKTQDINGIELTEPSLVKRLLKYEDEEVILLTTQLVAEWAKTEHNRDVLSEKEIVHVLLNLLESTEDIVLNVVRGLGNICYENETAAKMLDKGALEKILKVFYGLDQSNVLLRAKFSGLLLNILISNEDLKFIDKNELLEHVAGLLGDFNKITSDDTGLYSYLLQIVYTIMIEYDDQIIYSENLHKVLIDIFKNSNIPELELICLQILYNQSEKETVQRLLAVSNVCEKIFELIEKYKEMINDEESRSILDMACDLINHILIEDDSMKLLYGQGKGEVYRNSIKWLDSENEDLLATAIMAVGNFARNDENCIAIVREGISKKLIALIPKYSSNNPNIKLLYGLLSSLKNLVVPKANKSIILEEKLIESIQPVLELDQDNVIFKLLGTLRLVIDGQEKPAKDLITHDTFLVKLVKWYNGTYHLGVKHEVSRLLAGLIKNCHSWEAMITILQEKGTITCLVAMFSSDYSIMENEALVSLNLLETATREVKHQSNVKDENLTKEDVKCKLEEDLVEADIATVLPYIRIFSHSDQMIENLMNLLEKLLHSQIILKHFREKDALKSLKEYSSNIKSQGCLDKTEKIISILSQ